MDISSPIQVGMNDNDVSRKSTWTITKARKSEQSVPSTAIKFKFKEAKNRTPSTQFQTSIKSINYQMLRSRSWTQGNVVVRFFLGKLIAQVVRGQNRTQVNVTTERFSLEKAWTAFQSEGMDSDAGQRKTEFDEIIAKVVPGGAKLTPTTVSCHLPE